jgi:hypothetical protein
MFASATRKTSKILVILCIGIVFGLGVSCQLHASLHTHGMTRVGHDGADHDNPSASTIRDMACIVAVIPSIARLLVLSALKYDGLLPAVKPLIPAFEFDIPPRSAL